METSIKDLRSKVELDELLRDGAPAVLHFWASWCSASSQMDLVFAQLRSDNPHTLFYRVEAEETPEISEAFEVSAVPFFAFIKDGVVVDKLEGANPAELASKVAQLAGPPHLSKKSVLETVEIKAIPSKRETVLDSANGSASVPNGTIRTVSGKVTSAVSSDETEGDGDRLKKSKLQGLVASKPVMLFMKGMPEEPRCGFSRKVVGILKEVGVEFGTFDILSDEHVRQGLKEFSKWPTFPQLYIRGEFMGGCDIVTEMHKSGELKEVLAEKGLLPTQTIETRVKTLIYSSPTMLFMKGTPDAPRCGFSSKVVNALKDDGIPFGSFDILSDDDIRQGLKKYSNWPTYPQLYHNGELIGGCDIILELKETGELKATLS